MSLSYNKNRQSYSGSGEGGGHRVLNGVPSSPPTRLLWETFPLFQASVEQSESLWTGYCPMYESLNPAHHAPVYALSLCFPCASLLKTKIHHVTLDLFPLPLWNTVVMTEAQSCSCFTLSPLPPPPKPSVSSPPALSKSATKMPYTHPSLITFPLCPLEFLLQLPCPSLSSLNSHIKS